MWANDENSSNGTYINGKFTGDRTELHTNDIIVIAGKGHETYQILNDGTIHFDDREEARNAVHALHRGDK